MKKLSIILVLFQLIFIKNLFSQTLSYGGQLCAGSSINIYIQPGSNCGNPVITSTSSWIISPTPSQISYYQQSANSYPSILVQWNTPVTATVRASYSCPFGGSGDQTPQLTLNVGATVAPEISLADIAPGCHPNGSVTLTATNPINAGTSPTYAFYVDGVSVYQGNQSSFNYSIGGLSVGSHSAYVRMYSSMVCAGAYDDSPTKNFNVTAKSSYTLQLNGPGTICTSDPTGAFTVTPGNQVGNLTYRWYLNGELVGNPSTSPSRNFASLKNGDQIHCRAESDYWCVNSPVQSNTYTVVLTTSVTPTVAIQVPKLNYCSGETITFSSSITAPNYSWRVNGGAVVSTQSTLTLTTSTATGDPNTFNPIDDIVSLEVTGLSGVCYFPTFANTSTSTIALAVHAYPTANLSPSSVPKISYFGSQTINVSTGTNYIYQWKKDGVVITGPSSTSSSYTTNQAGNYAVIVTANNCSTTSNVFVLQVNSLPLVDAGSHQNVGYPIASITLPGTATDPDGTISSRQWTKISGPAVTMSNTTTNTATLTNILPGNYTFKFTATDNTGDSQSDYVNVSVYPVNNHNYVREQVVAVKGILSDSDVPSLPIGNRVESYNYFDGLGRAIESVNTQASPDSSDMVQPTAYDEYGREKKQYLPYVSTESNGYYKVNPLGTTTYTTSPHYSWYNNGSGDKVKDDQFPYGETFFESSPLNRPEKMYGPGKDWRPTADQGQNKFIQHQYLINVHSLSSSSTAEKVIAWELNSSGLPKRDTALTNYIETGGYYSSNQLAIKVTIDEKNNAVREYTNKAGQMVLKKVQAVAGSNNLNDTTAWALTYYVYDDFGNLRFVLPPELSQKIHRNDSYVPTTSDLNNLAFQYKYDGRRRMIEKIVPGAKAVYMVYDPRDRLVLTQDGNQRLLTNKEWTFIKYDALNRPVLTGRYVTNIDRPTAQSNVDTYYAMPLAVGRSWFESYIGTGAARLGYDNKSFPTAPVEATYLTATYYDKYDTYIAPPAYAYNPETLVDPETSIQQETASGLANKLRGQVTVMLVKNLYSNAWMRTVNYYDSKYRLVQAISDHQKGTVKISNVLDFVGRTLLTRRTYVVNSVSRYIQENPAYDHMGRLKWVKHSVNGGTEVVLSKNDYNELGQLVDKKLHSTNTSGLGAKQSVDYRYNIRGWLTRINDSNLSLEELDPKDFWGMNLAYNENFETGNFTITEKNYNGNISAMRWSNALGEATIKETAYDFQYDPMNRLKDANHKQSTAVNTWATGQYDENGLTYDLNGNILTLKRKGEGGLQIDDLVYKYGTGAAFSNRLMYVKDATSNATDKVKGFNDLNAGDVQDYTYDDNGNLTRDLNKGIGTTISDATNKITYNFLNLPETVTKGGNNIRYIYDATGRKLSQITTFGTITKQVDYIGELQFENDELQFINHAEGRIVMADNKLLAMNKGESTTGVTASNATLALVTQNGNEKYIRATSNGTVTRTGMFPIGQTFSVAPGEKYLVRAKGYRTGNSSAHLLIRGNVTATPTDINWPGAKLPSLVASESWIEQIVTIPANTYTFQAGLVWNTVTAGEIMFLNEFEVIKLTTIAAPEYQYHIKDHLGNVRVTFTTRLESDQSLATLEVPNIQQEQSQFIYYDEAVKVNATLFDHTYDGQPAPSNVQVTGVVLSPSTATVAAGQTRQLTKTILPLNASNLNVTWVSSNNNVATVNSSGLVTAVATGTATITALTQDGGYIGTSTITVTGGQNITILNSEFDSGTSNWSLTDFTSPSGASISVVTGAGLSGTNALKVDVVNNNNSVWMLQVEQLLNFRLQVGKTYRVSFMAKAQSARPIVVSLFGNGNNYNYYYSHDAFNLTTSAQTFTFDYTCSDVAVDTEPDFSLKFYLAAGLISDVWLDKVRIEDITGRVTGVSIDPSFVALTQGQTWTLTRSVTPSNANNQYVTWSSNNTNVAVVNSTTGVVTAVGSGTATITATTWDGGLTATSVINVPTFGATPVQNGEFDSGTANWNLVDYTNPSGASISAVTGAGLSGTNALRVDVVNADNSGWMLALEQLLGFRLQVGKTYRISFMAKAQSARTMNASIFGNAGLYNYFFSYGGINLTTAAQTYTFDYTCNDANVNNEPNFSVRFYLADGVISDVWIDKVTVQDITTVVNVTGVSLSPGTLALHVGQKSQLTRTITPVNATNQNVTWSTDNAAIATVSSTGLVTAVADGTTTIRATTQQGNFTDETTVTVTTPLPSYSTRLTGTEHEKYGLAKSLSVMPGDTITMEVYAKYLDPDSENWSAALTNLVGAIVNGTAPTGTFMDGGAPGSIGGTPFPHEGILPRTGDTGTGPKAYLNYIVFDKNYGFKTGGFKRLSATPKENGSDVPHEKLAFEGLDKVIIKEAGYVYIYLSNENDTPVEVFFDDFKVKHSKGPIVSSQDYYPFGLTYNLYQRENSIQQTYQYNGKEIQDELNLQWLDYGARMYDAQIGRWHVVDPLGEGFVRWSPYTYGYNSPARYTDPTGMANIDEVERRDDPNGKFSGGVGSEVEEAKRHNTGWGRKTSITTCSSCPAGKEYDVYREASHNFDYDSESGIVYNNDGNTGSSRDQTETSTGSGDGVDWAAGGRALVRAFVPFGNDIYPDSEEPGFDPSKKPIAATVPDLPIGPGSAKLAINGVRLAKQLASEAQMAEKGIVIIKSGELKEAGRLAQQYGGTVADWVKKSSSSYSNGAVKFETHWYENLVNWLRVEFKTKFP